MRLLISLIVILFNGALVLGKSTNIIPSKEGNEIWKLENFNKELFWEEPPEGLYEVDVGLRSAEGEQGNNLQAFSDLNNDKYTDIITVNDEKTTFTVHLFDPTRKMFIYQKTFKPSQCNKIVNLAVGRSIETIRLFITCQQSVGVTQVVLLDKALKSLEFQEISVKIPIEDGSQPYIADFNGDYLEDILYTSSNKTLMIAFQMRNPEELYLRDFETSMNVMDETEGCLSRKSGKRKLTNPHSASLIDFDGDCMSDLFITITDQTSGKSYYEIYLRREKDQNDDSEEGVNETAMGGVYGVPLKGLNSYCLVQREEIPLSTNNLFQFADVDRDAMVDMLFVSKSDLSLHVYYNKLLNQQHAAVNTQQSSPTAFGLKQLCAETNRAINKVKDIYSPFSMVEEKYVVKQLISKDPNAVDLYSEDDKQMPGRIHIGDITSDGFPDILITMKYINGTTKPHILVNSPCDSNVCSSKAIKGKRRSFNLQYNQYQSLLDQFDKVRYAVFFDLNENSMMDILLVKGGQSADIRAIYNNFGKDAFFLKTRLISDDSIGINVPSASFRCVLTDLEDQKFISMGAQSGQTAFQSLEMPFALIGIGRSNNFVESFTVAHNINGTRSMRVWTPIIPKSTLFVVTNGNSETESWTLDVLIKPNEKLILIIMVDAVFLLVLGLIIIILHLLEKVMFFIIIYDLQAEDRKEKQLNALF